MKTFTVIEALSNIDIIEKCKALDIFNFKGVFMRDELCGTIGRNESLVLNFDSSQGPGTHWVSLYSCNNRCYYFDSYGFEPPVEVRQYCTNADSYYNSFKIQHPNEVICGHYSIYVIYSLSKGIPYDTILDELYNYNYPI